MKRKNFFIYAVAIVSALLLFTGCADSSTYELTQVGHTYGFWGGLWHGMISGFDFIGMLFSDDICVYAPNNNGTWYAFGFVFGVGGFGTILRITFGGRNKE